VLVSAGGIGVAAASVIALLESSGTAANDAITGTLRVLAIAILVAAGTLLTVRRHLVRRGRMAPLSMTTSWTPPVS
jgi:hypothetical protein